MRRATSAQISTISAPDNFYPRPPRGGRLRTRSRCLHQMYFYPRRCSGSRFGSIISIHALREEGDVSRHHHAAEAEHISIHALREEGDILIEAPELAAAVFLSTPSVRRTTSRRPTTVPARSSHFYPRPPRGGRRRLYRQIDRRSAISIHALREEGDGRWMQAASPHPISIHALREEGDAATLTLKAQIENFYPRPPRGGRPC